VQELNNGCIHMHSPVHLPFGLNFLMLAQYFLPNSTGKLDISMKQTWGRRTYTWDNGDRGSEVISFGISLQPILFCIIGVFNTLITITIRILAQLYTLCCIWIFIETYSMGVDQTYRFWDRMCGTSFKKIFKNGAGSPTCTLTKPTRCLGVLNDWGFNLETM
jgi:hypothetical protein